MRISLIEVNGGNVDFSCPCCGLSRDGLYPRKILNLELGGEVYLK